MYKAPSYSNQKNNGRRGSYNTSKASNFAANYELINRFQSVTNSAFFKHLNASNSAPSSEHQLAVHGTVLECSLNDRTNTPARRLASIGLYPRVSLTGRDLPTCDVDDCKDDDCKDDDKGICEDERRSDGPDANDFMGCRTLLSTTTEKKR